MNTIVAPQDFIELHEMKQQLHILQEKNSERGYYKRYTDPRVDETQNVLDQETLLDGSCNCSFWNLSLVKYSKGVPSLLVDLWILYRYAVDMFIFRLCNQLKHPSG